MLTYVTICITSYLVFKILRAPSGSDATGYLLVSGLIPLPLYTVGNTGEAALFAIDVCLLAYILAHGKTALGYVLEHKAWPAGVVALFGFSVLALCSGVFNYVFVDPDALGYYAFTVVKLWEYALLAAVLVASKPNAVQLRRLCAIVLTGILVYEILHTLHVSGIVPLTGEAYLGPNAIPIQAADFSDRTGWFLTSYRGVIGGTASISAWFSLMAFEAYSGRMKAIAGAAAILSVFSVFATSSRSDIAGLVVAAIVFVLCAPPWRWKVYVCAGIAVAGLYTTYLTVLLPAGEHATEMTRIREFWNPELREEGSYGGRSYDRESLLSYLPDHPRELLVGVGPGNFHWYQAQRITVNFFGHNAYLHWTGELGIGGLLLLLAWCFVICRYTTKRLKSHSRLCQLAARACLAIVAGRIVAAWGGESLFGTEGMGNYSLYFVGVVYLLSSIPSDIGALGRLRVTATRNVPWQQHREAASYLPQTQQNIPSHSLIAGQAFPSSSASSFISRVEDRTLD